jgi:soluble P-type ATPase
MPILIIGISTMFLKNLSINPFKITKLGSLTAGGKFFTEIDKLIMTIEGSIVDVVVVVGESVPFIMVGEETT